MTHTHKRPRKILGLKTEIVTCAMFGENTFSELIEAGYLANLEYWRAIAEEYKIPVGAFAAQIIGSGNAIIRKWRKIEKRYKIPCPTCPKSKPKAPRRRPRSG